MLDKFTDYLSFSFLFSSDTLVEAEHRGKSVTLNKPFRHPSGSKKKFGVYVRSGSGGVKKVSFGDPNLSIKRDSPTRRKSFRARHNCATATDKGSARYWSCRQWRSSAEVEA